VLTLNPLDISAILIALAAAWVAIRERMHRVRASAVRDSTIEQVRAIAESAMEKAARAEAEALGWRAKYHELEQRLEAMIARGSVMP
jgi:hypothetical protein